MYASSRVVKTSTHSYALNVQREVETCVAEQNVNIKVSNFLDLCSVADPGSGAFFTLDPGSRIGFS